MRKETIQGRILNGGNKLGVLNCSCYEEIEENKIPNESLSDFAKTIEELYPSFRLIAKY